MSDEVENAEGDGHGRAADDDRHARREQAAEDEQQRQRGERQRDELAALQVALREDLDVAVERRATGEIDRDAGHRCDRVLDRLERLRRIVWRQVQGDDLVDRSAVVADLPRRERVGQDPADVLGLRHAREGGRDGQVEGRIARARVGLAAHDDDHRRRRQAELLLEQQPRARRLEVVE